MIRKHLNFDIKQLTTFGISAKCGQLLQFDTPAELSQLWEEGAFDTKKEPFVIGGGSNLLFTKPLFEGTILQFTGQQINLSPQPDGSTLVSAQAGATLDQLCQLTAGRGLWGLENLSGIPGTVGGAAVQNAGAYGSELADCLLSVEAVVLSPSRLEVLTFRRDDCEYGYRTSRFKQVADDMAGLWQTIVITGVNFRLSDRRPRREFYPAVSSAISGVPENSLTPEMVRQKVLEIRGSKLPDPQTVGSAGSFFKNPVVTQEEYAEAQRLFSEHCASNGLGEVPAIPYHRASDGKGMKLSAAWLIDHAGCKPLTSGGASLWPSQPLVIVNTNGTATGEDITNLEERVILQVQNVFGLTLTPEVIHL